MIHRCLIRAEELAPNDPDIQRRLLMLGRLHERDPKRFDLSVIKCYLLHAFEHPDKHTPEEARRMARELFDDPRLARCLALAGDREAFLRGYLEELSREYMRIFVVSDNSHVPRVFGFSFKGSLHRYLAVPARDIIMNALSSSWLNGEEAVVLAKAFYKAFYEHAHGESRELDTLLGAEVRAQLR